MRIFQKVAATLCLVTLTGATLTSAAHAQNAEDEDIPDDNAPAVAQPQPAPQPEAQPAPPIAQPETSQPEAPQTDTPKTAPATQTPPAAEGATVADTVTIPRAVWEQLQRDVAELKAARAASPGASMPSAPATETATNDENPDAVSADNTADAPANSQGNRNYLLLPDISFIGQVKGLLSSDRRAEGRGSLRLSEGELGIQSQIYPGVKADAFITGAPAENDPFQLEEGYLTFFNVRKGLNINVGRKFTPFGRTGQLHNHSWLYTRQLIPFRNLVSGEALTGDGVNFSYLIPTKSKLFAQLDLGIWNGRGAGTISSNAFGQDLPIGSGSGFYDRFGTARLWLGHPVGENGEFELGGSLASGRSRFGDDDGNILGSGHTRLYGLDTSYRRFMNGGKRLLLRAEYYRNSPSGNGLDGVIGSANGYYALANMRLNPYKDIGVLYENSGFPQAPDERERALSLIYTKQFTEQFYVRLQGTHGDRPGRGAYSEAQLQFVFGLGPHTHNLE